MRRQSTGEEITNSISHGIGLLAVLVATPFLIIKAGEARDIWGIIGASVFTASMALLYLASTLYHALPHGKGKRVFRVIEHSAIFILIAGTYTPFTLGILRGPWGWTLLALIWGLALAGVALKIFARLSHPIISTALYLLMGWLVLVAINPLHELLPPAGLLWLVAGGFFYTLGVVFFAVDDYLRYGHFVWHLFVMAGNACHYFAVLWYAT